MDTVTWGALALALTILGGLGTWWAFRRRGMRSGLRWLAATLLVPAAYLTRTLRMLGRIGDAIADWAASFVWNPSVWVGIVLAVVSGALFLVAGRFSAKPATRARRKVSGGGARPAAGSSGDPELDEIEALLKRRGIH